MPNVDLLPPVRPEEHFEADGLRHKTLDMRIANVFGNDLNTLIVNSVKATQVFHGIDLPDRVTLSHKQFVSVETNTQDLDYGNGRLYVTPFNVMEVTIDNDYQHVDEDLLDVMIGYESEEEMGITKDEAKGIILDDK